MGHGIEQAIMRFVRSTSVTLKVLTAMIQMCFGECNCWVQRQRIWELAITKVRSDNGKVILCYSFLKKQKQKKQNKNSISMNLPWTTVLGSLRKRSDYLRRNTGGTYRSHQTWRDHKGGAQEVVYRLLIGDMSDKDIQSRIVRFAKATRTRDNTHKQTTFIIFFLLLV